MVRRCAFVAVAVAWVAVLALPVPAAQAGEITDGCTARINGHDLRPTTKSNPIVLGEDETVEVMGSSTGTVTSYKVTLFLGLFSLRVASGSGDGNEWHGTVNVSDYARLGVGLYKVTGSTEGSHPCKGTGWVRIEGNPLTTAAGITGAALGLLGLLGLLYSLRAKAVAV